MSAGGWSVDLLRWDRLDGTGWRDRLRAEIERAITGASGTGHVVVDERSPGIDAETLRSSLEAARDGRARLGVRPVTDTIKRVADGAVVGTLDRSGLVQVAGPLVVPGEVVEVQASLEATVAGLAASLEVVTVEVPSGARRLADQGDLELWSLRR